MRRRVAVVAASGEHPAMTGRLWRGSWALGLTSCVLWAAAGRAESPATNALAEGEPSAERAVKALADVEHALADARHFSTRLDERAAFARLDDAENRASRALALRAAHAWLAEVFVQRGLLAAQAGMPALAASAFERAASLDPQRTVAIAEAPPTTITLAREARERVLARPTLPVPLALTPPDATVTIDGASVSRENASARGGPHVLLIEAPGYTAYASVVELSDGPRARLEVRLEASLGTRIALAPSLTNPPENKGPRVAPATAERARDARSPALVDASPRRWPWWLAGAAVVVAAATLAVSLRGHTDPHSSRTLVVDPGLPP